MTQSLFLSRDFYGGIHYADIINITYHVSSIIVIPLDRIKTDIMATMRIYCYSKLIFLMGLLDLIHSKQFNTSVQKDLS